MLQLQQLRPIRPAKAWNASDSSFLSLSMLLQDCCYAVVEVWRGSELQLWRRSLLGRPAPSGLPGRGVNGWLVWEERDPRDIGTLGTFSRRDLRVLRGDARSRREIAWKQS